MHYEYDEEFGVLIRIPNDEFPEQMTKNRPEWHDLVMDGQYMRAIYLGQGCWERLDTISEAKAEEIMRQWGAK